MKQIDASRDQKKLSLMMLFARTAVAGEIDLHDTNHAHVGRMLYVWGNILHQSGYDGQAGPAMEKSIFICGNTAGKDSIGYAHALACMAKIRGKQDKIPEAEQLSSQALAIMVKAGTPGAAQIPVLMLHTQTLVDQNEHE